MAKPKDAATARRAWNTLQLVGGLVGTAELRRRWGTDDRPLTRQRVQELTSVAGFPEPVVKGRRGTSDMWLAAEVDDWRRDYDARPKRRGPRPRRGASE